MRARIAPIVILAGSCILAIDDNHTNAPSRNAVLESMARDVVVPTYADLEIAAAELAVAVQILCGDAGPSQAALDEAQDAWRTARLPLRRADAFAFFGPIEDERIGSAIDFWPLREEAVQATLAAHEEPTDARVDALGVASKGLPAIEFLLFDPQGGDEAVLQALDPATDDGAYRCELVRALALDVAENTTALRLAWDPEGGDFGSELALAGEGSVRFESVQMAVDQLLNAHIAALAQATDMRIGKPLGLRNGGTPQPDAVESRVSDNTVADLRASVEGVRAVYLGADEGLGWTDLVHADSPALDRAIRDQLEDALSAVDAMATPVRTAVVDDPATIHAARDEILELRRLFTVDLIALFGGSVTFTDGDGD